MGKFTITGVFSIVMLNYQRVHVVFCVFYDIIIAHGMAWMAAGAPLSGWASHSVLTHFDVKQSEFNDLQPNDQTLNPEFTKVLPRCPVFLAHASDDLWCSNFSPPCVSWIQNATNTFKCSCSMLLAVRQYLSRLAASMPDIQTGLDSLDKECPSWTTLRS